MSDKLPKVKHNHTLTDILKASIFSLVMMAPVSAIGVTCAYVVCNKNAYQSYYGETINEKEYIDVNYTQLVVNKSYTFKNPLTNDKTNTYGTTNWMGVSDVKNINGFSNNVDLSNTNSIRLYLTENYNAMQFLDINNTQIASINEFSDLVEFTFTYQGFYGNADSLSYYNYFYTIEYNKYSYLDNVFYYAVDTMQNNTLFSWTKTTAIYTPVNAMTTGMGINTPAIAVLLVYWLLCTAVYIIIDIVVKGFTWLTHLIGER